jgi:hypothetical protein
MRLGGAGLSAELKTKGHMPRSVDTVLADVRHFFDILTKILTGSLI